MTNAGSTPRPLDGLRVIDFTHVMSGPFCTHFLRLMGAEVIKVESRDGDRFRYYRSRPETHGMVPAFVASNTAKKSVVLNLKHPDGVAAAKKLIEGADVVVENMSPGAMTRLGLGFDVCKALNDQLVYCSISGYGQSGPMRDYPAIDNIVQATAGLMSVNGEPDQDPLRVGLPIVDTYAGTMAAMAIVSALLQRNRFDTGARYIDLAMFDATLVMQTTALTPYLVEGIPFPKTGNTGYSGDPTSDCFKTGDGRLVSLGAVSQGQVEACFRALELTHLLDEERFATPEARKANAAALRPIIAERMLTRDGLDWEVRLNREGAPGGMARDLVEAVNLPTLDSRELMQEVTLPLPSGPQKAKVMNAGFQFDAGGPQVDGPPPTLGQHTDEVLGSLGFSADQIDAMRQGGAVA